MKLPISITALAGFVVLTVPISGAAQTQQTRTGQTEALTVTGCLRENPKRAGAFVLESVEGLGAEKSYRLIGSATADLKAHVGHKIKATGTVAKPAPGGATAPDATSGAGASEGPAMNVTTVAMVADSCSAPSR
jgi:hypothetical protein